MRTINWAISSAIAVVCFMSFNAEAQQVDDGKRAPQSTDWTTIVASFGAVGFLVWHRRR